MEQSESTKPNLGPTELFYSLKAKYLQVHEVSTTSPSKASKRSEKRLSVDSRKSVKRRASYDRKNKAICKENSSSSSCTSDTLTKSPDYLNIDFVQSVAWIPKIQVDFDECVGSFVTQELLKGIKQKEQENEKIQTDSTENLLNSKSKVPKLNRVFKKLNKFKKCNLKKYSICDKHLRSKKSLRRFSFKSVLFNNGRKQLKRQMLRKQNTIRLLEPCQEKIYTSTELIQSDTKAITLPEKSDSTPIKSNKLKAELEFLKNLTPEHKRALLESKKFLNVKVKGPPISSEKKDEKIEEKPMELTPQPINPPLMSPLTSEDIEVNNLMSNNEVQTSTESLPISKNSKLDVVINKPLIISDANKTVSVPLSSNTSSMLTVESPPIVNQSKSDETSELEISESVVEIISSTEVVENTPDVISTSEIQPTTCEVTQLVPPADHEMKSLQQCLTQPKPPKEERLLNTPTNQENWKETLRNEKPKQDRKLSQSHIIYLSSSNGAIMNAYYLDYNLIVVQESIISFWNQTPLGNMLGTQDMWIPKGTAQRLVLGNGCTHKESTEVVISREDSVAYIELWTKEHKSDKRERPVADIFVAIYLRLNRNKPVRKVIQLENIKG